MSRALRCCLLVLLVCAALRSQAVLGQQATLPGVPLVEPSLSAVYCNPAVFSAAPGGQSGTPAVYCAGEISAQVLPLLYLADGNGGVTASPQAAPLLISTIDPRPHGSTVWTLGFAINKTSVQVDQFEYAVMGFDSSSLALQSVFPLRGALTPAPLLDLNQNSTSLSPTGRVATDSTGRVYVSAGPQVYILEPSTGAQVGYFSLPNHDVIIATNTSSSYNPHGYAANFVSNEAGYAFAFDPTDGIWIVDANQNANGTYTLYHTSSSGAVLEMGTVSLTLPGDTAAPTFHSLAVDSAGVPYISTGNTGSRTVLAVSTSGGAFSVSAAMTYPSTSSGVGTDNTQLSISWGATAAQDAFYVQALLGGDVYVLDNTGAVLSSFSPNHQYGYPSTAAYDSYLDSVLITLYTGPHMAIRVARNASVLATYDLPDDAQFAGSLMSTVYPRTPAGDGTGTVAITFLNTTTLLYNVMVFDSAGAVTAIFTAGTGTGIQFVDGLIYVQSSTNASLLESYTLTGTLVSSVLAPTFDESGGWQLTNGALWSVNDDHSIVSIDLTTGVVTTLFANAQGLIVVSFVASPAVGLLYIDALVYQPGGYEPIYLAVSVSTGAIVAELDAEARLASALDVEVTFAIAADPSGTVFIPDVNAGLRVFAPVSVSSVKGDPQFVGLRGQSFQVHGLDGEVYALVSSATTQVNARFVFLSSGRCPVIDGVPASACWSHPGSYLGAIAVQQVVDGRLHRLLLTAGAADAGFLSVVLNDETLQVGRSFSAGSLSVSYDSAYRCIVNTDEFRFVFDNSDAFINQAVSARRPLQQLTAHGLFGQTHSQQRYASPLKYIEGDVDDYVIRDGDIFGHKFAFTRFNPPATQ